MAIQVGSAFPDVILRKFGADGMTQHNATELTSSGTVVIFTVPGAYTPTCHAKHVPSFTNSMDELKAAGVDRVACVSVNDPFVMKSWSEQYDTDAIDFLSDGNGELAVALDIAFDGSMAGLGTRAQRSAMIVRDGKIAWMAVEDSPPEMEVSGAKHVLEALKSL